MNENKPVNEAPFRTIKDDVKFGKNVKVFSHVNLYGCELADDVKVGTFVEIQSGVKVGRGTNIQSHTFIHTGFILGEDCYIGHGVMFLVNRAKKQNETHQELVNEMNLLTTKIGNNVSIGSGSIIKLGVQIGNNVTIASGSIITMDLPDNCVAEGNPIRILSRQELDREGGFFGA